MPRRNDRPAATDERVWSAWGPEATLFHFGTKNIPWSSDFVDGERQLREKALVSPAPAPVKRLAGRRRRVILPATTFSGELDQALADRRTWREFGRAAVSVGSLGVVLDRTFGVMHHAHAPGQGPVVLKTSPSGGACHPIEAYVLARRIEGLAPGLYHFEAGCRELALIRHGASAQDIVRFLPGQPWFRSAGAIVFMTAVFARAAWRYQTPRAYRAILLEAGHLCQTFLLVATKLGLAPFCTQALADSAIEAALTLDGVKEGVLYAAGIGTRPRASASIGLPTRFRKRLR